MDVSKSFKTIEELSSAVIQLQQQVSNLESQSVPNRPRVEIKMLDERLGSEQYPAPDFATPGSAAVDLRAMLTEKIVLAPGECKLIPAGFAVNMLDSRICAEILPRSGIGHKHGVVLRNLVGLIDSDYQGGLQMSMVNNGTEPFEINVGDRVAQLMFTVALQPEFTQVNDFSVATARGEGGFGHSGRS